MELLFIFKMTLQKGYPSSLLTTAHLGRWLVTFLMSSYSPAPLLPPSNSATGFPTSSQIVLHPSMLVYLLCLWPLECRFMSSPQVFGVALFIIIMLKGLRWVQVPPCSSRPLLSLLLLEPGSQAIHMNCPMNEGCTGECEEKENL